MDFKSVQITFFLVIMSVLDRGYALKCYKCQSKEPDQSCATPIDIDKTTSIDCNSTGNSVFSAIPNMNSYPQFRDGLNDNTKHECIAYEKFYVNENKTETFRECIPKMDYCKFLQVDSQKNSYNLTKCRTCDTDNCNSSNCLTFSGTMLFLTLSWYSISKLL